MCVGVCLYGCLSVSVCLSLCLSVVLSVCVCVSVWMCVSFCVFVCDCFCEGVSFTFGHVQLIVVTFGDFQVTPVIHLVCLVALLS